MELKNLTLLKLIFSIEILILVGCSPEVRTTTNLIPATTNSSTSPRVPMSTLFPFPGKIAFISSSGNTYYYHIYVMNANGAVDITPDLPEISGLAWSPNGEKIAFEAATQGKFQIFTIKADGSNLKQLTFGEESSHSPSWSPDGKSIIFLSSQKDILDYRNEMAQQAYIMDSDGVGRRRLVENNEFMEGVSYLNNDLIAVSVPATQKTIRTYVLNLDGMVQKQFSEFTIDSIPVWSPDNKFVLFSTIRADCSGINVMKSDGSNQQCLKIDKMVSPPVYASTPSWSPDGKYILFSSNLDGDYDIYVVKPDGSELIQLTNMLGDESSPVWASAP